MLFKTLTLLMAITTIQSAALSASCSTWCNECDKDKNECIKCPKFDGKQLVLTNKFCTWSAEHLAEAVANAKPCASSEVKKRDGDKYSCIAKPSGLDAKCTMVNKSDKCMACSFSSNFKFQYANKDGKCTEGTVVKYCSEYNGDGKCDECTMGYKLKDGSCSKNVIDCAADSTKDGYCYKCPKANQVIDAAAKTTCIQSSMLVKLSILLLALFKIY